MEHNCWLKTRKEDWTGDLQRVGELCEALHKISPDHRETGMDHARLRANAAENDQNHTGPTEDRYPLVVRRYAAILERYFPVSRRYATISEQCFLTCRRYVVISEWYFFVSGAYRLIRDGAVVFREGSIGFVAEKCFYSLAKSEGRTLYFDHPLTFIL
jgi:hypothetical protein